MPQLPPKILAKIKENETLIRDNLGDAFYNKATGVDATYQDMLAVQDLLLKQQTE